VPLTSDKILILTDLEVCSDVKENKFKFPIYSCDVKNSVMPWQRRVVAVLTWWITQFCAKPVFVEFGTGLCLRVYPYHYYSSCVPYFYIIHLPLKLYNVSHFWWCSIIHFSLSWYESTDKLHYGVVCYFKPEFYMH